jgi:hypothetical protein
MKVLSLTCNHCGAPLQVEENTRYLTCRFCSSQLEVEHSGNVVYTKVLQAIDQRTTEMAKDLDTIKRQNELEQLDREWQREREKHLVRGKNGTTSVPSIAGSLIGLVVGVSFGVFWMGLAISTDGPGFLPYVGGLIIFLVVINSLANFQKSANYREREAEYDRRRQHLQDKSDTR